MIVGEIGGIRKLCVYRVTAEMIIGWYWARTRDKASHDPIPIPLGYSATPCILGVDFICGSKIILDFDRKSLAIPDSQIDKVVKTIEEGNVKIDLSKTGFAVDDLKINSITKYPRYPLPLIDDLITNIPHTTIMSSLDLKSRNFQLAVSPSNIVKTTFVTKNGTNAFRRMLFGLSGAARNFQKAIDLILKPVIGKFESVYMDDVIILSPSFTHHVEHLREVFRLSQDTGLTLNKEKCKFNCHELKYLGLIISKEGIKTDETKVRAIVEMKPPRNSKEVSKFLGMSQWYAKLETEFLILNHDQEKKMTFELVPPNFFSKFPHHAKRELRASTDSTYNRLSSWRSLVAPGLEPIARQEQLWPGVRDHNHLITAP
ncbi:retrovirus-related Pol polyprotein from transposon opus [Trichonephila clavipes]|nr:retrovirus-related Pol polyprotein from transposon opus [Trichonephila clavipes]